MGTSRIQKRNPDSSGLGGVGRANGCWRPRSCFELTVASPIQELERVSLLLEMSFPLLFISSPGFIQELFGVLLKHLVCELVGHSDQILGGSGASWGCNSFRAALKMCFFLPLAALGLVLPRTGCLHYRTDFECAGCLSCFRLGPLL